MISIKKYRLITPLWIIIFSNIAFGQTTISFTKLNSTLFENEDQFIDLIKEEFEKKPEIEFIYCNNCDKINFSLMTFRERDEFRKSSRNFNYNSIDILIVSEKFSPENKTIEYRLIPEGKEGCHITYIDNVNTYNLHEKAYKLVTSLTTCILGEDYVITTPNSVPPNKKKLNPPKKIPTKSKEKISNEKPHKPFGKTTSPASKVINFTEIEELYSNNNFSSVLKLLEKNAPKSDSTKQLHYYYLGLSYWGNKDFSNALENFLKAEEFNFDPEIHLIIVSYISFYNNCPNIDYLEKINPPEWYYNNLQRYIVWWKSLSREWKKIYTSIFLIDGATPSLQDFNTIFKNEILFIDQEIKNFEGIKCLTNLKEVNVLCVKKNNGFELLHEYGCTIKCRKTNKEFTYSKKSKICCE